jgi:hypothetical protein
MYRSYFLIILSLFVFSSISNAVADDNSKLSKTNNDNKWTPNSKDFDWVQLTSGEWLKGEIKSMYKKKLVFDSKKLNLLTIKWEDVKYLKSHLVCNVKIENIGSVEGILTVSEKLIIISKNKEVKSYERSKVISFTPSGDKEIDLWSLKFTLSINLKSGNTEQVDYTSQLSAKRHTADSKFTLDYIGNLSKTSGVTGTLEDTINNHRLTGAMDIYVTRRFFYNPVNAEYYSDAFLNIDERITFGAGLGYVLKDSSKIEWNLSVGPAYITTQYLSVQPGQAIKTSSTSLSISTDIDTTLTSKLDFIYKYNIQLSKKTSGGYSHHMIATLENEVTTDLDLNISAVWDRITFPTVDDIGNVPSSDDYRLLVGVSYSF